MFTTRTEKFSRNGRSQENAVQQDPVVVIRPVVRASQSQIMAANKPLASMLGILLTTLALTWAIAQGAITADDINTITNSGGYLFLAFFGFAAGATVIGYATWSIITFIMKVLDVTFGFAWRVIWFIIGTPLYWLTGIGGKKQKQ